jgi:futalosine hydrolase
MLRCVILVVAAVADELAGAGDAETLVCGIGPLEAGIATAHALAARPPRAVLQLGVAGARAGSGLRPLDLVIGREAVDCDRLPGTAERRIEPAAGLLAAAGRALPEARLLPIGTSARVGGSSGQPVEAMEGYAVLRAAQQAGVPAIEVRCISNEVEERDRGRWQLAEAFAALAAATPRLVREVDAWLR